MITVTDVSLNFDGQNLFSHVDLKFTPGNCYGVIGANGAGKSTFLRILSGELEPSHGEVSLGKNERMSVLKQDHYAYDQYTVLDTIIMGNSRLYEIMKEKEALYMKPDFSDEDGIRASELEGEFAEMNGWEAESEASRLIQGLGLPVDILEKQMETLQGKEKVKVLLAQALFGQPDIILLDEPTNDLDVLSINWLENFLQDYPGTVIVVSHDRHFLNNVCTHIVDIDYTKIKLYVGNYDFWYESSQLMQKLIRDQNKKNEEKIRELQSFIQRFSANKSKSKQATSRRKLLDKLEVTEMPASSRRYPFVGFTMDREPGKEILTVTNLSKMVDGEMLLNRVSFRVNKETRSPLSAKTKTPPLPCSASSTASWSRTKGEFKRGSTITTSYFPRDNSAFFDDFQEICSSGSNSSPKTISPRPTSAAFWAKCSFPETMCSRAPRCSPAARRCGACSPDDDENANVLMLDQPTNHLDLESITAVNNGLMDFKSNVLFSSHDHQFIQTIANRIICLKPDGFVDRMCTYDEYLEKMEGIEKLSNIKKVRRRTEMFCDGPFVCYRLFFVFTSLF